MTRTKTVSTCRIHKFTRWPLVIGQNRAITFVVDGLKNIDVLNEIFKKIGVFSGYAHDFIMGSMGLRDFIDEIIYVAREPFTKSLWEFIFEELKTKADYADDPETAKRISTARGDWVIVDSDTKVDCSTLMPFITDKSIGHREFSKLLSDYMLYLLIWRPTMMSAVGGIGKMRFRDTCAEAERFFEGKVLPSRAENMKRRGTVETKACEAILSVTTDVKHEEVKGDRSKSALFDASMFAQELNKLEEEGLDKWKLMARVWVESVSYAGSHCRANTHAQQVSKGGELITLFGCRGLTLALGSSSKSMRDMQGLN
ncbi:putative Leucine-rich repeat family protein [Hibiscus syriacus]|uniref:Leucine-rich repeat family protein n=1 Tax=Hibiscus syriacus TaxID=106335 RepID=A0A6A3BKH7_HIBSY|nr:putative Leucine-rich repeat family protein [Hibiscus syriacus]